MPTLASAHHLMPKIRTLLLATAALLTAGPAAATAAAKWMGDADIKAAFAGTTIEGVYSNGETFDESYMANGRIDYVEARRKLSGHWSVVNAQFCTIYDTSPTGGCFRVTRIGPNCFEFYFQTRDEKQAAEPDPGQPSWTARGWRKGEKATCNEQPVV
jgi:hypothetical protein